MGRPPRGGRGLKFLRLSKRNHFPESPPSRGAWIEITGIPLLRIVVTRRPPRGGRGLKCPVARRKTPPCIVAPLAGGVD